VNVARRRPGGLAWSQEAPGNGRVSGHADITAGHVRSPRGSSCALGSNVLRWVEVPLVLGWGAPYPKAGVTPRWPRNGIEEGRVSTARWNPKGLRRSSGLESMGAIPTMNRSAKERARSSRHYGDEGVIHPPLGPRCVRLARSGRTRRDPRRSHRMSRVQGARGEGAPISPEGEGVADVR
jgi:hypothetical protein